MSVGQRDKGSAVFNYPRALHTKRGGFTPLESLATNGGNDMHKPLNPFRKGGVKAPSFLTGFTLIEVLISVFVLTVVLSGLFIVLNTGEFSNSVSAVKLELQQDVRRTLDWIIKDVRQTSGYQITNNNPTSSHIKFKVCLGHDGTSMIWSNDYIEYTYNSSLKRITRTDYNSGMNWYFDNIIAEPFDVSGVSTNSKLIVTISGKRQRQGLPDLTSTLTAQVKLRNG